MNIKFKRIQCIDRAVDILEAIAANKCRSVNEIAELSSLNQATAYNIVKTLESRGFISEDCNGIYVPGSKIGVLSALMDNSESLPVMTRPILEEVSLKTGEAVCITIMKGAYAEIVNLLAGTRQVSVQFLHRSWEYPLNLITGRLLVAMGKQQDWGRHIQRHLKGGMQNPEESGWDALKWESHLSGIRAEGFLCMRITTSENESIGAVAVPFRDSDGRLLGAIGSSCPQNRASDEHLYFIRDCIKSAITENPL